MADLMQMAPGIADMVFKVKLLKQQEQERLVRDDYLKSQKKILDAQFKSLEAENQWWDSQPPKIQKLRHLPKEMQMLGFMTMGLEPPPMIQGGGGGGGLPFNLDEKMTKVPQGTPAPPQGGGLQDIMGQLMMRGMFKKMLGIDPGEKQYLKGIAGEGGPVTLPVNKATGMPTGPGIPEAVKMQPFDVKTAEGTFRNYENPYAPGGQPGQGAQGIMTAPPEIEWQTREEGGETFAVPVNKVTKEQVGRPVRTKEEAGKAYELAGKMELAQTGIKEIENLKSLILNKDGSINRSVLATAKVNMPFSKGRTMKASFQRGADAIIRAATGAALNAQELDAYEAMYMANLFDSDQAIIDKFIALEEFLNGYLEKMDPTGRMRIKGKASPMREGGTMAKPPKLGGKGGYDYEYIPGQGVR